jgi:hypothetical protein
MEAAHLADEVGLGRSDIGQGLPLVTAGVILSPNSRFEIVAGEMTRRRLL